MAVGGANWRRGVVMRARGGAEGVDVLGAGPKFGGALGKGQGLGFE